jgi:hypothetical protein
MTTARLFTFTLMAIFAAGCIADDGDQAVEDGFVGAELELSEGTANPATPDALDGLDERIEPSTEESHFDPKVLFEPVPEPWSGGNHSEKK